MKLDLNDYGFETQERAEILSRLSVLFPHSEFTQEDNVINVLVSDKDTWSAIKQAGHDQMLRTKYEKDNRTLRASLYQRLLN